MGWMIYEEGWSFAGGSDNPYNTTVFWAEIDEIQAHQYANILYLRLPWKLLEPHEGVYAWDTNSDYQQFIQEAKDRGLKLAFRIKPYEGVPQFVYDAGARAANSQQPYYDDPIFLDKFENFIAAFAEEYNDPDIVDFIDAYGLGKWGEGHGIMLTNQQNYDDVIQRVTGDYARYFDKVLTVINLSQLDYHYVKPLVYDQLGFLPRRDGIGSHWFDDVERGMLQQLFPDKAFIAEGCFWFHMKNKDTTQIQYRSDQRFTMNNLSEVFTVGVDDALASHANTYDMRVPYQCKFYIEKLPNKVQDFISFGGYRFFPDSVVVDQVQGAIEIKHYWSNKGVGKLPNNHPNWNYKYKIAVGLMDEQSGEVIYSEIDTAIDPGTWLRGVNNGYTTTVNIPSSLTGSYDLCLAIVDTSKGTEPAISLAVDQSHIRENWLIVKSVEF